MDVESLAKQLILKGMTEEQQKAILESIKTTMGNARAVQKQRIGENVQMVVQALKKIEADIKSRYDETGKAIEKRVASIKDGQDGRDGTNGKDGRAGRDGSPGATGPRGANGLDGKDGRDGENGVSVTDAHIDFDGSLIISLSNGQVVNVGEVVSQDITEKIKVISTMSTNAAVGISDEGTSISTGVKNINFVGAAVTASASGDDVTVNVSAGTGTVTSVAVSGGTTGLTTSGGPITTTGTITLGGTLAVASGGTGTATPSLVAGTNITSITGTWPNQTINASGGAGTVTSVAATGGTGISVSGSPITTSGTLTITNTAPDQTVSLTAGTGISTSGTYPSFTITNSAPDQTVALTGAGTTAVTGTYPNFTITSNDQYVGTVTSVGGTGTVNGISLSGTVTSSGNLTLGGTLSGVDLTTQVTGTLPIANGGTGQTTANTAFNALAPSQTGNSGEYLTTDGTNTSWAPVVAGASISNDTSTATNVYPLFAAATSGTPTTIYTSNAKLLYKPSTGELSATVPRASNGIFVNTQAIAADYTIASGDNGLSAGPVTVSSGITVTVSSGSVWTVT